MLSHKITLSVLMAGMLQVTGCGERYYTLLNPDSYSLTPETSRGPDPDLLWQTAPHEQRAYEQISRAYELLYGLSGSSVDKRSKLWLQIRIPQNATTGRFFLTHCCSGLQISQKIQSSKDGISDLIIDQEKVGDYSVFSVQVEIWFTDKESAKKAGNLFWELRRIYD